MCIPLPILRARTLLGISAADLFAVEVFQEPSPESLKSSGLSPQLEDLRGTDPRYIMQPSSADDVFPSNTTMTNTS
ncbi:hypothetical protein HZ326_23060 [Fusarium oxysporum f. sp. albedinis]|nr:hypothetical protein HZ326_23060 [Fusarium oxysporum f. sp. albedinis]